MPTRILEKVILTYDFRRFRNSLTHFGALRRGVTLVDPSDPWDFLPRSRISHPTEDLSGPKSVLGVSIGDSILLFKHY